MDTQDEYNTYTNDMTLDDIPWKVDAYINCWGDSLNSPLIIEYQTIFGPWLAFIMQVHLDTDGNTRGNLSTEKHPS